MEITHTVTNKTAAVFDDLISLLRSLKVYRLNLHKVSAQGNALQNRNLVMSAFEWRSFVDAKLTTGVRGEVQRPSISVRYPLLFASESEYEQLKRGDYHHHVIRSYYSSRGHRVVLYCNGEVFISSEAFGTDAFIGRIVEGRFIPNSTARNEMKLAEREGFQVSDINFEIKGDSAFPIPLSFSYRRTVSV